MFCHKCGAKLEDDALYCTKCGTRFEYSESQQVNPPPVKKRKQGWIIAAIVIPVGILFLLGLSYSNLFSGEFEESTGNNEFLTQDEFSQPLPESTTVSIYVDTLPSGVNYVYNNAIREATATWEQHEDVLYRETSSRHNADLAIGWVKEFGGQHAGYAMGTDYIEIGIGDSFCIGKWQPYTYETVTNIALHELGHVLGRSHTNDPNDVMYHTIITKYETDIDETEFLPNDAFRFYPVCTKNSAADYLFEVTSDTPLDVWIVSSKNDFELLTDDKTFNYYPLCQAEEVTFYKKTCTVGRDAGIVLSNPTFLGLGFGADAQFHVKIKEL